MKGKTYTVSGTDKTGIMWKFEFTPEGLLRKFEFLEGDMTAPMIAWFKKGYFPFTEDGIQHFKARKDLQVDEGEPDISFNRFWDLYGVKQKRLVVLKIWEKLPDQKKLAAINGLKKYKNICKMHNRPPVLADSYIRQERWMDEM